MSARPTYNVYRTLRPQHSRIQAQCCSCMHHFWPGCDVRSRRSQPLVSLEVCGPIRSAAHCWSWLRHSGVACAKWLRFIAVGCTDRKKTNVTISVLYCAYKVIMCEQIKFGTTDFVVKLCIFDVGLQWFCPIAPKVWCRPICSDGQITNQIMVQNHKSFDKNAVSYTHLTLPTKRIV